ncbi:uncharacterized protein LOC111393038 [Olea europaea var. sylvestris]|uniref:uncharacterized protein LOC111393038 n=1 Tax=Olea europaea var. sylvestris TaxID=158386 RepID=UPI000C1D21F0|nr:uncharacterized protein LOC111393038 [Olea europaea var. sylvestris]
MDPIYTNWFHHGERLISNVDTTSKMEIFNLFEATRTNEEHNKEVFEENLDCDISRLVRVAETPLYPGNEKYTKLSSIVTLYKLKTISGWSDNSFIELLNILHDMLPQGNVIPTSTLSVRKFLKTFNLGYEKIHACANDCCLFKNDKKKLDSYPKCGSSRWKVDKQTQKSKNGVPAKVLRYFPIKPRFQRMFSTPKMAESLIWHSTNLSVDGKMRHLVDSPSWALIDNKWPKFANNRRNLKLVLATDGFNPFNNFSSTYSCWPIIRKFAYKGHNRFLSPSHPLRKKKSWFDGHEEKGSKPKIMSSSNILVTLKDYVKNFGKVQKRKRKTDDGSMLTWKKRSIFFNLPYWEVLSLRQNLDVKHIEKNICESIVGTLLDINGKTKNGLNARQDLQDMEIRKELHPEERVQM